MKRMSFALTTQQVLDQTKTVTRRNGWKTLMPGDYIQPVRKCMGLKKGEKQELLGAPIRIKSISVQRLYQMTDVDCVREGFPGMAAEEFIQMYMTANKCKRDQQVQRIEFEYVGLNERELELCDNCDVRGACAGVGCALEMGIRKPIEV